MTTSASEHQLIWMYGGDCICTLARQKYQQIRTHFTAPSLYIHIVKLYPNDYKQNKQDFLTCLAVLQSLQVSLRSARILSSTLRSPYLPVFLACKSYRKAAANRTQTIAILPNDLRSLESRKKAGKFCDPACSRACPKNLHPVTSQSWRHRGSCLDEADKYHQYVLTNLPK